MPRVSFDLRELELCVIWIHAFYFLTSWSPEYLKQEKIIHIIEKLIEQMSISL